MAKSLIQLKKEFGARLTEEMIARGYKAKRAKIGAKAEILQEKSGVKSLEMARRYLKGTSMPEDPKIINRICKWLGVREAWLLRGELPKTQAEMDAKPIVDKNLLAECVEAVIKASQKSNDEISTDALAKVAAVLYTEQMNGAKKTPKNQIVKLLKSSDSTVAVKG